MQPGSYVTKYGSFAQDMTPVITKALGDDWQSKVAPAGVSGLTDKDGKLTALSVGAVYSGTLWINKGLFDKHNLKPPTTLDEWEKVCQEFKKANQGCFVQGAAGAGFDQDTLQAIANSVEPGFWTKASKGEAKWNEPAMVKTLDIWKQLFSRGIMQEGAIGYQQYPDANNDFLTGKYAMVMMGTWYTQYSTEKAMTAALKAAGVSGAKPFPIRADPVPGRREAGNTSEMFGDADYGLAISTKAKNKAAAETFVTWLTTSTGGTAGGGRPVERRAGVEGHRAELRRDQVRRSRDAGGAGEGPARQGRPRHPASLRAAEPGRPGRDLPGGESTATGKATPEEAANTLQKAAEAAAVAPRAVPTRGATRWLEHR